MLTTTVDFFSRATICCESLEYAETEHRPKIPGGSTKSLAHIYKLAVAILCIGYLQNMKAALSCIQKLLLAAIPFIVMASP